MPGWRSSACQIAGPRPPPSVATAEDEPSWLVQFDRLAVRLPEKQRIRAYGAWDNSSGRVTGILALIFFAVRRNR